ncbi:MAG: PAS domain S-box protein [Anaerolineae bacterium]|nr:PAS domain S-box protein [Anaerolineae bacterium]
MHNKKEMDNLNTRLIGRVAWWQKEWVRFIALAVLGGAASYLSVNIPGSEVFFDLRWIFGFIGFALLQHGWSALLLAFALSLVGQHTAPLNIVLLGNMLYTLPCLLVIRAVYTRRLVHLRSLTGYGLAWLLMVLFCYQLILTPSIWGFIAFLHNSPIWPGVLAGWREQPFLVESLLVGIISALMMVVARSATWLDASRRELFTILYSIGDGVIATDSDGHISHMNPVAEQLTGWREAEAVGRALSEVFAIINEKTRRTVESPVARILRERHVIGLANHTLLIARDGAEIPIADAGAPIVDPQGNLTGVVLVFREQYQERLHQRLIETRLALIEYAAAHTLDELLTRVLDLTGELVDSPIGFYHFVDADQETLALQQWSTRTLNEFCRAEAKGLHYPIAQAGVWVDCVHQKKPVVHNNYAALPHKKGLPEGHAPVIRELVVPVMREGQTVAILGVGNKPVDYTDQDVECVSYLADVTWELVQRRQAEESLRQSEQYLRTILQTTVDGFWVIDTSRNIVEANDAYCRMSGYSRDDLLTLSIADLDANEDPSEIGAHMQRIIAGGSDTFETRHRRRDGSLFDAEIAVTYLESGAGEFVCFCRDISEQKQAQRALRESEERHRLLFENASQGIGYFDPQGRVIAFNALAASRMGGRPEDFVGQSMIDMYGEQAGAEYNHRIDLAMGSPDSQSYEDRVMLPTGEQYFVSTFTRIIGTDGRIAGVQIISTDITVRAQAEAARARSQRLLLALNQAAQAVQRARTAEDVYRAVGQEVTKLGLDATALTLSEDHTYLTVSQLTFRPELVRTAEKWTGLSVKAYRVPILPDGFFQRVIDGAKSVFCELDSGILAEALPRSVRPLAGRLVNLLGWKHGIFAPLILEGQTQGLLVVTGADLTESDVPAIVAFANQAAIALENARLYQETQQLAVFNRDIVQNIAEGIMIQDADRVFTFVNPAAAEMLGYTPEELVGSTGLSVIPPEQWDIVKAADERRLHGESDRYELEMLCKDGRRLATLVSGSPRFDGEGHIIGMMAVFTDITERKRAEAQIQANLAEKEALLREVHHRVKNNLQVISSLLDFQAQYARDEQSAAVLRESQGRVHAMALVHELLYQPSDLSRIDMATYMQTLAADLLAAYGSNSPNLQDRQDLRIQVDLRDIFFEVQRAIPCGLIVNELVSNALKYAFPADAESLPRPHLIHIAIDEMAEHRYRLCVSDNGVGLPPGFRFPSDGDFYQQGSLGLFLIDTFVRQLKGHITWHGVGGTRCEIVFEGEKNRCTKREF